MAAILSIDESAGLQQNDTASPLPAALTADLTAILPGFATLEKAEVNNALGALPANVTDIAFTDSTGAALNGIDSGLVSIDGHHIFLYTYAGDNNLVIGREGSGTGGATADPNGAPAIAIYLQSNGSPGDTNATSASLWVVEFTSLDHPDTTNPNDFVELANKLYTTITNPVHFDASGAPSGSNLFITFGDGTPTSTEPAVVATAFGAADQSSGANISSGNVVKTSQAGSSVGGATFGVNSQMFNPPSASKPAPDAMYFTFVNGVNPSLTVPNLSQTAADLESNIQFTNYVGVTKVSFIVSQLQPASGMSTMEISALVAASPNAHGPGVADDAVYSGTTYIDHQDQNTSVDINQVTITRNGVSYVFNEGSPPPANAPANMAINFSPTSGEGTPSNSAVLTGLLAGDKVTYQAPEHDRLEIINVGNSSAALNASFDIGGLTMESGGHSTSALGPIDFHDDGPTVAPTLNANATVSVDESGPSAVPAIDTGTIVKGVDPYNPNPAGGDALNVANSGSAVVTPNAVFGADGPAASSSLTYALSQSAPNVSSGLTLTDGTAINLTQLANGNIVGVVQGSGANAGKAAFAITIDAGTGVVTVEQYLALHQNSADTNGDSNEAVQAALNTIGVTVTATDGDGDSKTSAAVDISHQISFHDDGPTITGQANPADNNLIVGNVTSGTLSTASSSYTLHPGADGPAASGSYVIVGPPDSSGALQWTYNDATHTAITETYNGSNLFSLTLNPATGGYTMKMLGTLPDTLLPLDVNNIHAGGPTGSIEVGTINSTDAVLITGTANGSTGFVNASNGNVGVNNGNLDSGEALTFALYTDFTNTTLIPFHGINIGTKTPQATTLYHVTGVIDAKSGGGTFTHDYSVGKNGTIQIDAGNLFLDSISVTDENGNAIKVGLAGISLLLPPNDVSVPFGVQLTDGDGDKTAVQNFTASIDGNGDGLITNPTSAASVITLSAVTMAALTTDPMSASQSTSLSAPLAPSASLASSASLSDPLMTSSFQDALLHHMSDYLFA